MTNYKILDCTLRDGGYINNWNFSDNFVNKYFKMINILPIEYVEIGFINNFNIYKNQLVGKYRYLNDIDINKIKSLTNKKIVVMGDYNNINKELLYKKIDIDIVRIAFHKKELKDALSLLKELKDLGYIVSANAMATINYTKDDLKYLIDKCNEYELDYLYVADSYGNLFNEKLLKILDTYNKKLINTKIGIHLHNNMQNSIANITSINDNVDIVDTTLYGMGRGAGNLPLELLLCYNKYNNIDYLIKCLIFIQKHIKKIYEVKENKWGYDLDYLLSGYLNIHPNYISLLRDLDINMLKRFNIIKHIYLNLEYNYFNKDVIMSYLLENKNNIYI
jgi:4-hydroxy 2-oxovalerate aldolase